MCLESARVCLPSNFCSFFVGIGNGYTSHCDARWNGAVYTLCSCFHWLCSIFHVMCSIFHSLSPLFHFPRDLFHFPRTLFNFSMFCSIFHWLCSIFHVICSIFHWFVPFSIDFVDISLTMFHFTWFAPFSRRSELFRIIPNLSVTKTKVCYL